MQNFVTWLADFISSCSLEPDLVLFFCLLGLKGTTLWKLCQKVRLCIVFGFSFPTALVIIDLGGCRLVEFGRTPTKWSHTPSFLPF